MWQYKFLFFRCELPFFMINYLVDQIFEYFNVLSLKKTSHVVSNIHIKNNIVFKNGFTKYKIHM